VRVGVDKIKSIWSPLPFIPSHQGEGRFLGDISEKVRDKFLDLNVQGLENTKRLWQEKNKKGLFLIHP
jgi:hypothetical protein